MKKLTKIITASLKLPSIIITGNGNTEFSGTKFTFPNQVISCKCSRRNGCLRLILRSHRLIQREKQTTISTENPSNLCPPHSHLSGKKAVTLYFDGCRFPIGRSPELGVHRLHFGIAFDFWHRYKSSSWNFLNRSLLTRVPKYDIL